MGQCPLQQGLPSETDIGARVLQRCCVSSAWQATRFLCAASG